MDNDNRRMCNQSRLVYNLIMFLVIICLAILFYVYVDNRKLYYGKIPIDIVYDLNANHSSGSNMSVISKYVK